jgi:ABC-type glutathione transport system ATPase component
MIKCQAVTKNFYSGFFKKRCHPVLQAISLTIAEGHTYALCGASGSGKSTLGRILLGLVAPSAGNVFYDDVSIQHWMTSRRKEKDFRQRNQIVFQNPQATLYPDFTIRQLLEEPYRIHSYLLGAPDWDWIEVCLKKVKLSLDLLNRYPEQLSGGQLQRVCIARSLLMRPSFLVLDEPTAMLDPTVQMQLICLLKELQQTEKLTYLFISHDLNLARYMADEAGFIYQGRLVEQGPAELVLQQPQITFTRQFIRAFDAF